MTTAQSKRLTARMSFDVSTAPDMGDGGACDITSCDGPNTDAPSERGVIVRLT